MNNAVCRPKWYADAEVTPLGFGFCRNGRTGRSLSAAKSYPLFPRLPGQDSAAAAVMLTPGALSCLLPPGKIVPAASAYWGKISPLLPAI